MQVRRIVIALAMIAISATSVSAQEPLVYRLGQSSGWLGFSYSSGWNDDEPLVVDTVIPESPAARAGMQKADTVLEVNGLRATARLLGSLGLEPGDRVELTIRRSSGERTLELTAAERPEGFYAFGRGDFVFRTDSVMSLVGGMLDSVRVRLDSLKFPQIYFRTEHDSTGRAIIIRGTGTDVDTMRFEFSPDSLHAFHFFGDSMRSAMDSVFVRVARPGVRFDFSTDSILVIDGDTVQVRVRGPFREWSGDFDVPRVRGITRVGFNAVGGMILEELTPGLGAYFGTDSGLLVLEIGDDTPAEAAGLQEGDVIVRADGEPVDEIRALRRTIAGVEDDQVELTILRERRELTLRMSKRW